MKKLLKKLGLALTVAAVAVTSVICLAACNNGSNTDDDIEMVNYNLTNEQYAFGLKKSDTELLNKLNQIMTDKAAEIKAIMDKYLNATDAELDTFGYDNLATTASTDPAVMPNEFVVHTNIDFKPFEYYNGSKIAGIDIEIAKLFADELGQKLVVVHNPNFDAVVTAVQTTPQFDIAMAGLTISPDRAEQLNFTKPYYDSTQVILVKKGNTLFNECKSAEDVVAKLKTLTGNQAKCGGQKGTSSYFYIVGNEALEYEGYSNLTFKQYPGAGTAVTDMINGNIEFVVVDKATGDALIKSFNNN